MSKSYETSRAAEGTFVDATAPDAVEQARALHHLATADPEPERDGLMTGPAHEAKYGLERAEDSAAIWRANGVHPIENRALVAGEDGAENLRGATGQEGGKAEAIETTSAPRAAKK
ncbi:MAG: hypothetical protein ACXVGE_13040 [Blastococcus sp.]